VNIRQRVLIRYTIGHRKAMANFAVASPRLLNTGFLKKQYDCISLGHRFCKLYFDKRWFSSRLRMGLASKNCFAICADLLQGRFAINWPMALSTQTERGNEQAPLKAFFRARRSFCPQLAGSPPDSSQIWRTSRSFPGDFSEAGRSFSPQLGYVPGESI
jgi:hypothetical protein